MILYPLASSSYVLCTIHQHNSLANTSRHIWSLIFNQQLLMVIYSIQAQKWVNANAVRGAGAREFETRPKMGHFYIYFRGEEHDRITMNARDECVYKRKKQISTFDRVYADAKKRTITGDWNISGMMSHHHAAYRALFRKQSAPSHTATTADAAAAHPL